MAASVMRSFLGLALVVSLVGACAASSAGSAQNGNDTVTIVCKGQRWCGIMNYTEATVAMKCAVGGKGKNESAVTVMEGKVVQGETSSDGEDNGADDGGMKAQMTRTINQTLKRSDECSVQLSMPYNSLCTSAATKPFRIASVVSSTANNANASSANNNKQPEISFSCQAPQGGAALTDSKMFVFFFFFKNFNPFFG